MKTPMLFEFRSRGFDWPERGVPIRLRCRRLNSMRIAALALVISFLLLAQAQAGNVHIVNAQVSLGQNGLYRFSVTLRHADNGWDHYADRWEVLGPDGTVLGTRVLLHPHVAEQPFTRSLSGIEIPIELTSVFIRAHDKEHGDSPNLFRVTLPGR